MLLNINPHTKVTAGGREETHTHNIKKNSCRKKKKERRDRSSERKKGISAVNSRSVCLKTFQMVGRAEKCISWGRRQWAEGAVRPQIACQAEAEAAVGLLRGRCIPEGGAP